MVLAVCFAKMPDWIVKKYVVIFIPNSNQCLESQRDTKHGKTFLKVRDTVLKTAFIPIYPNLAQLTRCHNGMIQSKQLLKLECKERIGSVSNL